MLGNDTFKWNEKKNYSSQILFGSNLVSSGESSIKNSAYVKI